jgi:hypothetical protein
MHKELIELGALRLDRGWTYRRLAVEVNKVSAWHVGHSRLFDLLNDDEAAPNDLTLHGIRKFLAAVKKTKRRASKAKTKVA